MLVFEKHATMINISASKNRIHKGIQFQQGHLDSSSNPLRKLRYLRHQHKPLHCNCKNNTKRLLFMANRTHDSILVLLFQVYAWKLNVFFSRPRDAVVVFLHLLAHSKGHCCSNLSFGLFSNTV